MPYAYLVLIDRYLIGIHNGTIKRLAVFLPPRHGKSELISRYFPAWFLMRNPKRRIILASYEADFAATWGRKARELVEQHGQALFGLRVRGDSSAANRWDLEGHEGGMQTAGVRGPITGKGARVFIIDDPVKNDEEAQSEVYREKTWDWYQSTVLTRLDPDGAVVLMQTRWNEDDLGGRILKNETGWTTLTLPAIAEEDESIGIWKRAKGEPLCPERFSREALEERRRAIGAYWWSALYQQRPTPLEGGLFKRSWFRYYRRTPEGALAIEDGRTFDSKDLVRFSVIDLAASLKETADYTVIGTWGLFRDKPAPRLFLLDLVRERLEGPDIIPAAKAQAVRWSVPAIWVEKVGFQLALIQTARRDGLPVRELERTKDKVGRALGATPLYEAGRVYFPVDAPWLSTLENELLAFPNGAHDDILDVCADAANIAQGLIASSGDLVIPPSERPPENKMREQFSELLPASEKRFNPSHTVEPKARFYG